MPHPSDPRLLVLHAVRVKGIAAESTIAETAGLPVDAVVTELSDLQAAGAMNHRDGRISGWSLTPEGRAQHDKLMADELDRTGAGPAIGGAYRGFLAINADLLAVCTDWQLKRLPDGTQVLNQHDDRPYDESVVARLHEVDAAVQPVCRSLAEVLDRFSTYGPRLSAALQRVDAGEMQWFTKPLIDSYHTVWFELHEDLLSTLGIERSKEEA